METNTIPKKEKDSIVVEQEKNFEETVKSLDMLCYDMSVRKLRYKKYIEKET